MARPTSQRTVVSRLFQESARPIYLLDAEGTILYANEALASWVQVPLGDLVGLRCRYLLGEVSPLGALAQQLSPPPQTVEEAGFQASLRITIGGRPSQREASFFLLTDDVDASPVLVIVDSHEVAEPVTDNLDSIALHQLLADARAQWSEQYQSETLIGQSSAMQRVRRQVGLAAEQACDLVISGPAGSGREHLARSIHHARTAGRAPLVPLSCHLLDDELLPVALQSFQYERDSTDTAPALLLLQIDELPLAAQHILIAYLEQAGRGVPTMATAQRRLTELPVSHFVPELADRLTSLELVVPPLHERLADVPLLAQWFLEARQPPPARPLAGFTPAAMASLVRYRWPGEVDELRQLVEEAADQCRGTHVDVEDLPAKLAFAADAESLGPPTDAAIQLDALLLEVETEAISRALAQAKSNKAAAARLLGISRARLLRRLDQLGMDT